ncbi:MAG: polysaccharide deacetylase [Clostridia bacterium]|nr:polysaccharide deacetylase [Clostridia bacterium]
MKKREKLFVSRYVPYSGKSREHNSFILQAIGITAIICIVILSITLSIARQIPKEVFVSLIKTEKTVKEEKPKPQGYIYPQPDSDTRAKADRLREIRYEDYLMHCYNPTDAEMDNVYIFDNDKKCYLTFDDGPSDVTPAILDVLKQYKAKATFFVMGTRVEANPEIVKQIYDAGHAIGNHSYSHDYNSVYESKAAFKNEVKKCRDAINNAIGKEYTNLVFRFPGGYTSLTNDDTKSAYREALKELGYKYIDWSCLTGDSETTSPTPEFIMDTLRMSIGRSVTGDIVVLMHDSATKEITAKTLPKVIEYLYEQGYEFEVLKQ